MAMCGLFDSVQTITIYTGEIRDEREINFHSTVPQPLSV
jgi:hypothetical protein